MQQGICKQQGGVANASSWTCPLRAQEAARTQAEQPGPAALGNNLASDIAISIWKVEGEIEGS